MNVLVIDLASGFSTMSSCSELAETGGEEAALRRARASGGAPPDPRPPRCADRDVIVAAELDEADVRRIRRGELAAVPVCLTCKARSPDDPMSGTAALSHAGDQSFLCAVCQSRFSFKSPTELKFDLASLRGSAAVYLSLAAIDRLQGVEVSKVIA